MKKNKSIKKHFNLLKEFRKNWPSIKSVADLNNMNASMFIEGVEDFLNFNSMKLTIKEINQDDNSVISHNVRLSYQQILLYSFFLDASNISKLSLNDLSSTLLTEQENFNNQIEIKDDAVDLIAAYRNENKSFKKNSLQIIFENQIENSEFNEENFEKQISDFFKRNYRIDTVSKKTEIIGKLLGSQNLNEFKAYLFYFLYKKFYDASVKLSVNPNDVIEASLELIVRYFKNKLEQNQSALTVNFGAYFEEVFRKVVFEELGISDEFDLDISHASKKSAIALIFCCNNRYEKGSSAVFDKILADGQNPSDEDYKKDFDNIRYAKGKDLNYLSTCIKKIVGDIKSILDLDNNLYFNDLEKDVIFKDTAGKNAAFDFIARDVDITNTDKNIGLLDLKINNSKSTSSSPISKGATGSNGGTQNTALQMIQKFIKKTKEVNKNNIGISFFSLMQIKYTLNFNDLVNHDIEIDNFEYKISKAKESIEYSMDKKDFFLSDDSTQKMHSYNVKIKDSIPNFVDYQKDYKVNNKILNLKNLLQQGIQTEEPEFSIVRKSKANKSLQKLVNAYKEINKKGGIETLIKNIDFKYIQSILSGEGASILKLIHDEYDTFNIFAENNNDIKNIIGDELVNIKNDKLSNPNLLASILIDIITMNPQSVGLSKEAIEKIKIEDQKGKSTKFIKLSLLGAITSVFDENNSIERHVSFYKEVYGVEPKKITKDTRYSKRLYPDLDIKDFKRVINNKIEKDYSIYYDNFYEVFKKPVDINLDAKVSDSPYLPKIDDLSQNIRGIQLDHKNRKGKNLKEVYLHLFEKKLIKEGGLAGHMMHPYEALDMTPRQIIDRIKEYSTSQSIIEKVDGQNLFFTVEEDGTLMFARNKEDMTHDDLVKKFTGHGAEKPFIEGGNAIKRGVEQWLQSAGPAAEVEIREIFHPDGETKSFVNFEIMHPDKPNQIIYDEKYIVFHSIVDYVDGRSTMYSTNKGQRLEKIIRLMDSGISSAGFTLASNRTVNLNELTNVQIEDYVERVKEVALSLGISEDITLGEGIENIIKQEIEELGINLDRETLKKIYDFVLYGEDRQGNKIKSRDFTSSLVKSDVTGLRNLDLTSANKALSKVQRIISPFKDVFVDLGIDLLKGVKSAYMSDKTNQKNIELLRDKLQTAMDDLIDYMNEKPENYWEAEVHRLRPYLDKVIDKDISDIVSTAVEGGVYDYQGDLLKVTGGFAPLNQILGAAYRDKKGIFPTFKEKFMKQESNRRSLKNIYKMLF